MAAIESLAFAFPAYRIRAEAYVRQWGYFRPRGIEEKTVAGYDEDEVTLAVAAARRLPDAGVGYLAAATSSGEGVSATVAAALGLEGCRRADFGVSTNAGGEALLTCLDFVDARGERALLVVADAPRGAPDDPQEHGLAAGAAALLLGPKGGLEVEETASATREEYGEAFRDPEGRWRSLEVVDMAERVVPRVAAPLLERGGRGVRVACAEPDALFSRRVLRGLVPPDQLGGGVVTRSGDTGAASAFLALVETVRGASRGDRLLLVTYGGGGAVGVLLRVAAKPRGLASPLQALAEDGTDLDYATYARFRRYLSTASPSEGSMGAYLPLPAYLESVPARYRLVADRCKACGRVQFPPRPACRSCGDRTFEAAPLSGQGEVHAVTVIARGSAPTEFREQQDMVGAYAVALVQLTEGPRIVAQVTDCRPEEVEIGTPVEAVLRRVYRQEGVVRYGYKFRPSVGDRGRRAP